MALVKKIILFIGKHLRSENKSDKYINKKSNKRNIGMCRQLLKIGNKTANEKL